VKRIFQFWGYSPAVWARLTGDHGALRQAGAAPTEMAFGIIRFSERTVELLPQFADELGSGLLGYVKYRPDAKLRGDVVVEVEPVGGGAMVPLVSLDDAGRYTFAVDVQATAEFTRQEQYLDRRPPFYARLGVSPDTFPALLRNTAMRAFGVSRALAQSVRRSAPQFPRCHKDLSVDAWLFLVLGITRQADSSVTPSVDLWPEGRRYAITLSHDLDTDWGIRHPEGIAAFRAYEEKLAIRSAWLAVATLRETGRECLHELAEAGHEIGFHGTVHDHATAYLPPKKLRERVRAAGGFLEEFQCKGFRSPSYHRSDALYAALDGLLEYDMSMHDCVENVNSPVPKREGCSTCFPFWIRGTRLLEIPTTVPEDFVLEMTGRSPDEVLSTQKEIVRKIGQRRGVANILTHPEPQLSSRPAMAQCYQELLDMVSSETDAWVARPGDVWQWWTEREERIRRLWGGA